MSLLKVVQQGSFGFNLITYLQDDLIGSDRFGSMIYRAGLSGNGTYLT